MRRSSFHPMRGAALIIVLAFVVLLTGLCVAYFSRTISDRQIAHGSFNQANADQLASSAVAIMIGDLRQEIINGSTPTVVGSSTIYTPLSNANMVPIYSPTPVSGTTPSIPNLIRRSARSDAIPAPAMSSRASAVNSTSDISANGRSVSLARWNSHYLIEKSDKNDDKSDPITTGFNAPSYWSPDWVIVTRDGPVAFSSWNSVLADQTSDNTSYAVGRYAYAIYDEGGLLDINVAGYPTGTTLNQAGRKGSLAFADLTALLYPIPNPNSDSVYKLDKLIGWRNYATTQPTNDFPETSASKPFAKNFQTDATRADAYYKYVTSNTNGFLAPNPSATPFNDRSDQAFVSRQELIQFSQSSGGFTPNALQYLTHFSREAKAASPQWSPPVPDSINPNFQTLRVTGPFTRNDGVTQAIVDEPLVKTRFLLQRLNWLTYKGPSASRLSTDPDIAILTGTYGVLLTFLQQGTDANILKYFGLAWDLTNERWNYVGHSGGSALLSSIATLGTLTNTREPDFFELLQAGILNVSLGDSSGNPPQAPTPTPSPTPVLPPLPTPTPSPNPALPIVHQQSKVLQILTIGANLISQARTDSYPTRIACSVDVNGTPTTMEAVGSQRLPYLNSVAACPVGTTGAAGGIHWFLVPNIWDPFRNNWDLTEALALTPPYPRPPVRITVSGNGSAATIAFGSVLPSPFLKSGSIPPASAATFPAGSIILSNQSLTLKPGDKNNGRDAGEASRLGTTDLSSTATVFNPTTSPTSPLAEWDSIPTISGSTRFIAYRLSLMGTDILPTAILSNPVLILKNPFQMMLEYQSPTDTSKWYPYSYLQGNNAPSTWISGDLYLATTFSQYGLKLLPLPAATSPTLLSASLATPWATATLAEAPMFAKADPRSIRYNSEIGVISLPGTGPTPTQSAGVVGSIWPNGYVTPPTMAPAPNPANYSLSQGDYRVSGGNAYNESNGNAIRSIVMNRPFRSVGEMAYSFRDQPFKTIDFSSAASPDAGLLDLFSVNEYNDTSGKRAGVVNMNTRQGPVITAVLNNTIAAEGIAGAAAPSPSPITNISATAAGPSLALLSSASPVVNKAGLASLIGSETGLGGTVPKTERESIARALGEVVQTRTWNLLIDVIAQSGRYAPGETDLTKFIVQGEQRYWVHVAIDRFTGEVIDKQIEVVNE